MQLFNTRSLQKEAFVPREGAVRIYVCGITPYDVTHLGHAFSYVFYDTLRRYLEYQGHAVDYVQNITDVDDDIIRKAAELGQPVEEVVAVNVADFDRDMEALNVQPPTHYPRASEQIERIQGIVQELIATGHAYAKGGDVFFRTSSFPEFGMLSHRMGDGLISDTEPERLKQRMDDAHDFTLWQASLPGEPAWPSPWGEGRPGWHIECAAMSTRYLGTPVDIHGGGSDLIFPHHESEIAQVVSYTGEEPFVRYWVHNGMLRIDGEKMSKSLKNLILAKDLLQRYTANTIRAYLLSNHYRGAPAYREAELAEWVARVEYLREALETPGGPGPDLDAAPFRGRFEAALDDDMDTPEALNVLGELASEIIAAGGRGATITQARDTLRELCGVLGLRL
jgi:cysteinyl-tRNA synthetase